MNIIRTIGLALVLFATVEPASAIESLGYETVEEFNDVEIRQYEAHLLASVRCAAVSRTPVTTLFAHCLISLAATTPRQLRSR